MRRRRKRRSLSDVPVVLMLSSHLAPRVDWIASRVRCESIIMHTHARRAWPARQAFPPPLRPDSPIRVPSPSDFRTSPDVRSTVSRGYPRSWPGPPRWPTRTTTGSRRRGRGCSSVGVCDTTNPVRLSHAPDRVESSDTSAGGVWGKRRRSPRRRGSQREAVGRDSTAVRRAMGGCQGRFDGGQVDGRPS